MHEAPFELPAAGARPGMTLELSLGDPMGHAVAMAHGRLEQAERRVALEPTSGAPVRLSRDGETVSTDLFAIAHALSPDLFPAEPAHSGWLDHTESALLEGARLVGEETDPAAYESALSSWKAAVDYAERHLATSRYLLGTEICFADLLLFAFAARLEGVFEELSEASPGASHPRQDLPGLRRFARHMYERYEVRGRTDWDAIRRAPRRAYEALGSLSPQQRPRNARPHRA